jgi:hypothetical protein
MAGLHVASVQPAPTFSHGTSPIVASTPCAAAGAAGGVEVAADVVGLADVSWAAGELVCDEQPAVNIAAIATMPTPVSNL